MDVLFASSEIFPYAKTGGLADVAYSLPLALKQYTHICRVMPLYGFMQEDLYKPCDNFTITLNGEHFPILVLSKKEKEINTYFIKAPHLSQTKHLYGDANGDYADNALRFGIFCMAVVELALRLGVDILHLNDWHTALAALFVKEHRLKIKTLFTIHNLAYQGIFDKSILDLLEIPKKYFQMEALEFYGQVNLLKAGIACSDAITTVSPTYAREILTPEFGCGLDGFLQKHKEKLSGILNGIDYEAFPPLEDMRSKRAAKRAFCKKMGFADLSRPLFIMVSRLCEQKGIDLLIETFKKLQNEELDLFIIGEGDAFYGDALRGLDRRYENFRFFKGYEESLSHEAYLASDFLLMPSRFEPCGLNQFIAMNNAAIPVVHEVGGLKDSVHEGKEVCGQGIGYTQQNTKEFFHALKRALKLYEDKKKLQKIIDFNLTCDFSFDKSAKKYLQLYREIV